MLIDNFWHLQIEMAKKPCQEDLNIKKRRLINYKVVINSHSRNSLSCLCTGLGLKLMKLF